MFKKYDLVLDPTGECDCCIVECEDGKYVKFDEIKEFLKEIRDIISKKLHTTSLCHHHDKRNLLKKN